MLFWNHPVVGLTELMVRAGRETVNTMGEVLVPPFVVVTLTVQVFPNCESAGTVKLPVMVVDVTAVDCAVTLLE